MGTLQNMLSWCNSLIDRLLCIEDDDLEYHTRRHRRDNDFSWDSVDIPEPFGVELDWVPTDDEICLIRQTFSDDFTFLNSFGIEIVEHLFDARPELKAMFPDLRGYGGRGLKWKRNPRFRRQIHRFMSTWSYCVLHLHNVHMLYAHLHHLGAQHTRWAVNGGQFKTRHWMAVRDAVLVTMSRWLTQNERVHEEDKADVLCAWTMFTGFVVGHVHYGYEQALCRQQPHTVVVNENTQHAYMLTEAIAKNFATLPNHHEQQQTSTSTEHSALLD